MIQDAHGGLWRSTDQEGRFVLDHAPETVEILWMDFTVHGVEFHFLGDVKLETAEQSVELTVPIPLRRATIAWPSSCRTMEAKNSAAPATATTYAVFCAPPSTSWK